jgi:hypothetical protein
MAAHDARERYLEEARSALRNASLDELLGFISVRRIVGGTATASFYQAFPGGREELLRALKDEAAPAEVGVSTPVTVGTVAKAMRLVAALKDEDPDALEELRDVALTNFEETIDSEEGKAKHVLRGLMGTVALADPEAREQLRRFYDVLAEEYGRLFDQILAALDREPIEPIGSVDELTMTILAMYAGLSLRSRVGQPGKELLAVTLLPVLAALTRSVGSEPEDPIRALLSR